MKSQLSELSVIQIYQNIHHASDKNTNFPKLWHLKKDEMNLFGEFLNDHYDGFVAFQQLFKRKLQPALAVFDSLSTRLILYADYAVQELFHYVPRLLRTIA